MKILDNNIVRDMTEEEIEEFLRMKEETDEPFEGYTEEATAEDYQTALAEMGVEV